MAANPEQHMQTLRQAARSRDQDARADLYGDAMRSGLEAAVPRLSAEALGEDRVALAMFMRAFPRPAWLPVLGQWQGDGDEVVRAAVVAAMALQSPTDDVAAIFDGALHDASPMVRVRAVRAMSDSGAGRWRALLQEACDDEDGAVRERALAALR